MKAHRSGVVRLRPDQPAVAKLFQAVCGPPDDTSGGESGREQFGRQAQTMQQQGRVEFDVGVETPVGLVFAEQAKRRSFHFPCEVI